MSFKQESKIFQCAIFGKYYQNAGVLFADCLTTDGVAKIEGSYKILICKYDFIDRKGPDELWRAAGDYRRHF